MGRTYVVTGAGRGIGRAVVERLLADGAAAVAAIERDPEALAWADGRVLAVTGDAADPATAEAAADRAEAAGTLAGWVNNAAVFRDASLHAVPVEEIRALIARNLDPALAGCAAAVRRFLAAGTGGAIVNVSSHQARAAVPGCLPYATAKAAIEGLTRALAVDYGPHGIRVNAVAPGTIRTERYDEAQDAALGRCTRSAASGRPARSPRRSRSSSATARASSRARPSRSTAGAPCWHPSRRCRTAGRRRSLGSGAMSGVTIVGAPTSAGAYAPGQEEGPRALRAAGLLERLQAAGLRVTDAGDVDGFRWRPDPDDPRAANAPPSWRAAAQVAERVAAAAPEDRVLVLGGDCTTGVGTVAGPARARRGPRARVPRPPRRPQRPREHDRRRARLDGRRAPARRRRRGRRARGPRRAAPDARARPRLLPRARAGGAVRGGADRGARARRRPAGGDGGRPARPRRAGARRAGRRRARSRCTSTSTWSTSSTRRSRRTPTGGPGCRSRRDAALHALLRDPRVRAVTVTEFNPAHGDDATTGRLADALAGGFAP